MEQGRNVRLSGYKLYRRSDRDIPRSTVKPSYSDCSSFPTLISQRQLPCTNSERNFPRSAVDALKIIFRQRAFFNRLNRCQSTHLTWKPTIVIRLVDIDTILVDVWHNEKWNDGCRRDAMWKRRVQNLRSRYYGRFNLAVDETWHEVQLHFRDR